MSLRAARAALEVLQGTPGSLTAAEIARAVRAQGIVVATGALERGLRVSKTVAVLPGPRTRFHLKQAPAGQGASQAGVDRGGEALGGTSWTTLFDEAAAALYDAGMDAIVVGVLDSAKVKILFDVRMDRVLAGVPQVAVAMPLAARALADVVAQGGLDCWPWPWQVRLGQRSTLTDDVTISAATPALGVACKPTPQEACAQLRELVHTHLGITDLARIDITFRRCDDAEEMRRLAEIEGLPRRRTSGGGSRRAPAVSSCDRCGQPLSDPFSVSIGVGPECQRYYDRTMLQRIRNHPKVEPRAWVGVKTQATWLTEIRSTLLEQ